jgi:hypothetical protein
MTPEFAHLEDERCERCYQWLSKGAHGVGVCPFEPRKGHVVIPDDVPGGFVVENGFATPQKFYSKKEHRRALAENGNMLCDWNRGDHDKVCPRWDAVDLESAAALVARHQKAYKDDVPTAPPALVKELKERLYR